MPTFSLYVYICRWIILFRLKDGALLKSKNDILKGKPIYWYDTTWDGGGGESASSRDTLLLIFCNPISNLGPFDQESFNFWSTDVCDDGLQAIGVYLSVCFVFTFAGLVENIIAAIEKKERPSLHRPQIRVSAKRTVSSWKKWTQSQYCC